MIELIRERERPMVYNTMFIESSPIDKKKKEFVSGKTTFKGHFPIKKNLIKSKFILENTEINI